MVTTAVLADTSPQAFEALYAQASGDASLIPWDDGHASPALVNWLNAVAPSLIRCGARVAVVGCGLGHDARELIRRGYETVGFDCSATAIAWARRLDPANAGSYVDADLFDPPHRWKRRFDLVVEVNTIQALAPDRRHATTAAIAELVAPRGHLLVICRGCETSAASDAGPPWPMTQAELEEATALAGLVPDGPITSFDDDEDPPVRRMRALFRRA